MREGTGMAYTAEMTAGASEMMTMTWAVEARSLISRMIDTARQHTPRLGI